MGRLLMLVAVMRRVIAIHPSVRPRLMLMADDWSSLLLGCGTRWYSERDPEPNTLV